MELELLKEKIKQQKETREKTYQAKTAVIIQRWDST